MVQKGWKGRHKPWYLGIRFVLLIVCCDVYRIPVGFRIILPKTHPKYRNENKLFREMVEAFQPPTRATTVIVIGDVWYGSAANMKMVKQRHNDDPQRNWYFVFAVART